MAAEPARLTAFAAVLAVRDVGASLAFYLDRLGFREQFRLGDPPEYAILDRDAVSLHLMPAARGDAMGLGRSNVYVFTPAVDRLHEEFREAGCAIEVPPTDFPYGMREMSLRDPDGNRITFGQDLGATG
jgi:catechol 2,3-dioxygenase-like lactoylglutathione lyase family enzyme